jgi:hypothetical protein
MHKGILPHVLQTLDVSQNPRAEDWGEGLRYWPILVCSLYMTA